MQHLEWGHVQEDTRVERLNGKNKGKRGTITRVFSVSGTFRVRFDHGATGAFCKEENFSLVVDSDSH